MVVAESAHAAFHKAAHLFGITLHKTAVGPDWRVDLDAMADAVNENTILVVGSAPQPLDMFTLGDALAQHGWFHDRHTPPDSLHSTVSNGNALAVDDYLTTLRSCIAAVGADQTDDRSTNYATLE